MIISLEKLGEVTVLKMINGQITVEKLSGLYKFDNN